MTKFTQPFFSINRTVGEKPLLRRCIQTFFLIGVLLCACPDRGTIEAYEHQTADALKYMDFEINSGTNFASWNNPNSIKWWLGVIDAGTTIRLTVCPNTEPATFTGDTYLRLFDVGPSSSTQVDCNDDRCGLGSSIVYTVYQSTGSLWANIGCWQNNACSGRVVLTKTRDANPAPISGLISFNNMANNSPKFLTYDSFDVPDYQGYKENHQQGIQRLQPWINGYQFVVSTSEQSSNGELSFWTHGSYGGSIPDYGLISNYPRNNPLKDRQVYVLQNVRHSQYHGMDLDHVGGIQAAGRYLVVAIERLNRNKDCVFSCWEWPPAKDDWELAVWDLGSWPPQPAWYEYVPNWNYKSDGGIKSAGMTKLQGLNENQDYMFPTDLQRNILFAAVNTNNHVQFGRITPDAYDGMVSPSMGQNFSWYYEWRPIKDNVDFEGITGLGKAWKAGQQIYLTTDYAGKVWLITLYGDKNYNSKAYLYRVLFEDQTTEHGDTCNEIICLEKYGSKTFNRSGCGGSSFYCAGGIYTAPNGTFRVYASECGDDGHNGAQIDFCEW